jgi:cytoskeleton protein RodZ
VQATGIGPALRKARLLRGKSIEEASRETRIRAEYLAALERERFESLLGDVYVRGFLRSYSSYLGLDSDKVLSVYNRHFGPPRTPLPRAPEAPPRSPKIHHSLLPSLRGHHLSWRVLVLLTAMAVAVLAAAGWFSRSRTAPLPAVIPSVEPSAGVAPPTVSVAVDATAPVRLTVRVDGHLEFDGVLRADEGKSFEGERRIDVALGRGARATVVVNGHSLGSPGSSKEPFAASYEPSDFRPSPRGTSPPGGAGAAPGPS